MENLPNIILGIQIGFLISSAGYLVCIARMPLTRTAPYYYLCATALLMAFWRINKIYPMVNDNVILAVTTATTVLIFLFARNIYNFYKRYE